ncbi:MAG: hypothetical protein ACLRXP_08580 [Oscillospiraceae bacterium]
MFQNFFGYVKYSVHSGKQQPLVAGRSLPKKTESGGEDKTNILSAALWTFRRVGHGVGQAVLTPEKPNK